MHSKSKSKCRYVGKVVGHHANSKIIINNYSGDYRDSGDLIGRGLRHILL